MANLSTEILHQIFELACTDDGTTGRALSLVSTRINNVSLQHKYFSIHVAGAEHLAKFASFVEEFKPPIQYLTLNYNPTKSAPGVRGSIDLLKESKDKPPHPDKLRAIFEPLAMQSALARDSMYESSSVIFSILSPILKGLYLIHGRMPLELGSYTFSKLDTLYIYGSLKGVSITWNADSFPSLRRLDVSCTNKADLYSLGHGRLFGQIMIPTLTHFGCCAHYLGSGEILVILGLLQVWVRNQRGYIPFNDSLGDAHKLLQLEVLKLRLLEGFLEHMRGFEADTRSFEGWPENFPKVITVDHKPTEDDIAPMDGWNYVISGGEGFQA